MGAEQASCRRAIFTTKAKGEQEPVRTDGNLLAAVVGMVMEGRRLCSTSNANNPTPATTRRTTTGPATPAAPISVA